ncbi:MAG: DUF3592 domain-containing protein [Pyrinomonadaceae bacterium]
MGLLDRFRRQKEDPEVARRARLLTNGRVTEGSILDIQTDEQGLITSVFYHYEIAGVEYQSSQPLDDRQRQRQDGYAPGACVTIRFDPRQPTNSVVV